MKKEQETEHFTAWASRLVDTRPVELAEWAHKAKIDLIAAALRQAYRLGQKGRWEETR